MLNLRMVEFYITNRCNLDCNYCNRLNNYNFKGQYELDPYKQLYKKWSNILQIEKIALLGGEPLLHKDLFNWISFLNKIWPQSKIEIVTNGTILNKVKNLYSFITSIDTKVLLDINVHNFDELDKINNGVKQFLNNNFQCLPTGDVRYDNFYKHKNLEIIVRKATAQHQSVIQNTNKGLYVHNSDPSQAHSICTMKFCHHFVNGKLYKCGIPIVVKEFAKQYHVNLTEDQKEILKNDVGLCVDDVKDMDQQELNDTIRNQPIPHCNFCPDKLIYNDIQAKSGYTKLDITTV